MKLLFPFLGGGSTMFPLYVGLAVSFWGVGDGWWVGASIRSYVDVLN